MRAALLVCVAAAGCGRLSFDPYGASDATTGDGKQGDATADASVRAWSHLVAYADQTCAIHGTSVYCWGQVGDNVMQTTITAPVPHGYDLGAAIVDVAAGDTFMCVASGGHVNCFGATPGGLVMSVDAEPITAVAAGRGFACYIATGVSCWGANDVGQLGLGDMNARPLPTMLGLSPSYTQIRAGDDHACAYDGITPVCWGHNDDGTMGTGSNLPASQLTPQPVTGGVAGLPLIAGWHACALSAGSVSCWGRDTEGELGDGTTNSTPTPVQVASSVTVLAVGGGPSDYDATCTVSAHPQCWGDGAYGRLGQGMAASSNVAVDVQGLPDATVELAIGYDHACAILADDSIWCWGRGDLGQLGDGNMTSSLMPVKVATP